MIPDITSNSTENKVYIIVARHGERYDYEQRKVGKGCEWILKEKRPWDPSLSSNGFAQATKLGKHLSEKLEEMKLPPITECYTSPFLRCRQTSCQAVEAINNEYCKIKNITERKDNDEDEEESAGQIMKVRIEYGLSESISRSWYRSWALPGSDTTWGFVPNGEKPRRELQDYKSEELNPSSQVPVQELLHGWESIYMSSNCSEKQQKNDEENVALLLEKLQDTTYESCTGIDIPYALKPEVIVESHKVQQKRMFEVLTQKVVLNNGAPEPRSRTLLLVSHGSPVIQLYKKILPGKTYEDHGDSKYCCYSIYEYNVKTKEWSALVVNESKYLESLWSDVSSNI